MKYMKYISLIFVIALLTSCSSGVGGGGGSDSAGTSEVTMIIGSSGQANLLVEESTLWAGIKDFFAIFTPSEAIAGTVSLPDQCGIPDSVHSIVFTIQGSGIAPAISRTVEVNGACQIIESFTVPNGSNRVFNAYAYDVDSNLLYSGATIQSISGDDYVRIIMKTAKPLVYVSNADSDDVSAIDPVTFNVETLDCSDIADTNCTEPRNLAVSYDGSSVAVPFRHSDNVININTTVPVFDSATDEDSFDEPYAAAFSCDDSEVWVVNKYDDTITVINAATKAVVQTIENECLSSPEGIAITNNIAYIANRGSGRVCVMNTLTRSYVTTIDVGGDPRFAVATPDGTFVYVSTDSSSAGIKKIRTSDNTVAATIELRGRNLAVTPDGSKVYVGTQNNSIGVINVATDSLSSISIPGAGSIYGVAILLDGSLGFATDENCDYDPVNYTCTYHAYVFDPVTDTVIMDGDEPVIIEVGDTPRAIATQPAPMSCETPVENECDRYVDVVNGNDYENENSCAIADDPCQSISHAIDISGVNETICIAAGQYTSNYPDGFESFPLTPHTGTRLLCQGAEHSTEIVGEGDTPVITPFGGDVSIEGCTVVVGDYVVGIYDDIGGVTVDNCIVRGAPESYDNVGIELRYASTVRNSTITGMDFGIEVRDDSAPTITNNKIYCNSYANLVSLSSVRIDVRQNSWNSSDPRTHTSSHSGPNGCYEYGSDICYISAGYGGVGEPPYYDPWNAGVPGAEVCYTD